MKVDPATTIQRHWRGYAARVNLYDFLCTMISTMPSASTGKTPVYFPQQFSRIILKHSGYAAKERLLLMRQTRALLKSLKCTHLEIPWATLCGGGNFLAEKRLKINVDSNYNRKLYLSNPGLFDEAVREMTRLFSKAYIPRLVKLSESYLSIKKVPRYDNIPLTGEGRIGLIDLQRIRFYPDDAGLKDLAAIFPCHLNTIQEEALRLGMNVDSRFFKRYLGEFEWSTDAGVVKSIVKSQGSSRIQVETGKNNVDIYLTQPQLFDYAVRELVRLFCSVSFDSLVHELCIYDDGFLKIVRLVPNMALYPDGSIGLTKISWVDFVPDKRSLNALITIFPHQKEIILEEAKIGNLEGEALIDKPYLGKMCWFSKREDNRERFDQRLLFLKENQVDRAALFDLSETRMKELIEVAAKFLINLNPVKEFNVLAAASEICALFMDRLKRLVEAKCIPIVDNFPLLQEYGLAERIHNVSIFECSQLLAPLFGYLSSEPLVQQMRWNEVDLAWKLGTRFLPDEISGKEIYSFCMAQESMSSKVFCYY